MSDPVSIPDAKAVRTSAPGIVAWLNEGIRRQSRKLYRLIRHPKNRSRGAIRTWLASRIRNRDLWRLSRHPVANGMAGGLFFAMLPLPLQSVFAAWVGIARGWNIPATICATWLSNPLTYPLMAAASKGCIQTAAGAFGEDCAMGRICLHQLAGSIFTADWQGIKAIAAHAGWWVLPEFLLGLVIAGLVLALLGWLAVHAIWPLFGRVRPGPRA